MAEPSRILFAIPELGSGGPDRVFHELICGLDRAAFRPLLVVSRAGGRYFDALPGDVETCAIGGGRYPVWRFARAVDRLRPALVITTLRMNTVAAAARALQRHQPMLIARQANAIDTNFAELRLKSRLKYGLAERITKGLLRVPDALVAQSADMGAERARHAASRQQIAVIGNPVSLDDVAAASVVQQARAAPVRFGDPALIAVGRLVAQKGFDLLLPALANLCRTHPRAGLTILGEGPDRAALEAQAARLGIAQALRLPGYSDAVLAEVAAADLFVSCARYEGFSNAILEAMALGKPVVASCCEGGTRDMVIDGQTGFLADPGNPQALASALQRALSANMGSVGTTGQRHVDKRFGRAKIISEYSQLFQELLSGMRGQHTPNAMVAVSDDGARKGEHT
jgi:glycosyltransferase involved in cell wall biosynthesis